MYKGNDFWKNYMLNWFGEDLIRKWESHCQIDTIRSNGRDIHLEIYSHENSSAPTVIFSHGIAGYARVLLPFIIPVFEKGYNCVVPDLQGYGYNAGVNGDFEWNAHVQNLVDTVAYAKKKFDGLLILSGMSMGGPLAYSASCVTLKSIDGIACWCLWDFSDKEFMLNETATGKFTYLLLPFLRFAGRFFGKARVKTYKLISYDTLTGSDEFNALIKKDPQAGTHITLKGASSLLLQSAPPIPFEKYTKPVLVLQPGNDRMTPLYYSRKTFKKIGSKQKKYVEMDGCEHFPLEKNYFSAWGEEVSLFIQSLRSCKGRNLLQN